MAREQRNRGRDRDSQYGELNGQLDLADLQKQAEMAQQQSLLQGGIPDISKVVDTRFTEAAVQQIGKR